MKLVYKENCSKFSGIYKIINTHTNRIYIGQCKSFQQRWFDHKKNLLNNKHKNKFLLNDFNKCKEELGHDDFLEFHVLEIMENSTKEQRNICEEKIIAEYFDKQYKCYNFKQKTDSKERSCFSNTPEQTKALLSEKTKLQWQNEEYKQLMSEKYKKFWNSSNGKQKAIERNLLAWQSAKRKEKASITMKSRFANLSEEEKIIQIKRLRNGLKSEHIEKRKVDYRKNLTKNVEIKEIKDFIGPQRNKVKFFKNANLLSPDGILYKNIFNLRSFATTFNLDSWKLQQVINCQRVSYKGWIKHN